MQGLIHLPFDTSAQTIVDILQRDGGVIIDNVLSSDALIQLKTEMAPFVDAGRTGRDAFTGHQTTRFGALIARSPACGKIALHPLIHTACELYLGPYCETHQLNFSQAISIGPGESGQSLHRDRGVWGTHLPRSIEPQFSTVWALTDFTQANGATRIVPGSHLWEDERTPKESEVCSAEMSAGSVLIYNGSLIHGGGANQSQQSRLGVFLHYTLGWLRQEENQYLSCPPDMAKTLTPELRALLGYTKSGYALGFFSEPSAPGQGLEMAPPEHLFGDKANKKMNQGQLQHVVDAKN